MSEFFFWLKTVVQTFKKFSLVFWPVFAKLPIFGKPITDLKLPIGNGNYRR
jgi:hypothetical protein